MMVMASMILATILCVVLGVIALLCAVHAKWLELINPPLKYDNSNGEWAFRDLKQEKTRKIIS